MSKLSRHRIQDTINSMASGIHARRQERLDRACRLDRLADAELHHGHVLAAERLSHVAADLRDTAP